MKYNTQRHSVDLLFILLLFAGFLLTAVLLVTMGTREYRGIVETMQENSKRIIDSYDMHKDIYAKCSDLLNSVSPEYARESQIDSLKNEIAELKSLLSAALGNKQKEDKE